MSFSFLFDYDILNTAFFGKVIDGSKIACKDSIDKALRLSKNNEDTCSIFAPSQSIDKLKRGFETINGRSKFEDIFKRQGATQGVAEHSPEDEKTIRESSRALSFYGRVITISNKELEVNTHVKFLSPAKFIYSYEQAKALFPLFKDIDDIEFIDVLIFVIFHKNSLERLKKTSKPLKDNSESEEETSEE